MCGRGARGRDRLGPGGQGSSACGEPRAPDPVRVSPGGGRVVGDRRRGRRPGAGSLHRYAGGDRHRKGAGVRPGCPDDRNTESRPPCVSPPVQQPSDRGGHRCAVRGEVFYAFYRQVPGGVQRVSDHLVGRPDDVASQITAMGDEVLLVGDGAHRYIEHFDHIPRVELAENSRSFPSACCSFSSPMRRHCAAEFHQPSELAPIYLRKPDADIGWTTRDRS